MNNIIKFAITLAVFCSIASFGLGFVYSITEPRIAEQRRLAIQEALESVLPMSEAIVPMDEITDRTVYRAYASGEQDGPVSGYAFLSYGQGYSSKIQTMVGVDTLGIIQGIKILYQQETPGLGAKVMEINAGETTPWFQKQFTKLSAFLMELDKDGGTIRSITGSTISSRAVTDAIKKDVVWLRDKGLIKSSQE